MKTNDRKEYATGELIRRFIPYYKPYVGMFCFNLFCALLTCGCEMVLPLILRFITNTGQNDATLLTVSIILKLSGLYILLKIIECLANYFMAYQGHVMGVYIETDMRTDAYAHMQRLSVTYYNNTKIGQLMGRITNDLFEVTEFAHHCPEEFFIAGIKIIVSFVILVQIDVALTVILFAIIPVMTYVCLKMNRKNKKAFADQRVQIGELTASIEDSLLGQRVVKAFANEDVECAKFAEGNILFQQIKKRTYRIMGAFQTSTRAFDGLLYIAIVMGGGLFVIHGRILAGDLVAYVMYVSTLIATIRRIIEFAEQFQRGITGIERFFQIMDEPIEIKDAVDAVDMKRPEGDIVFDHVTFEFPDDHNQVFRDMNLRVHPGERLAIVGPSGGGKTTLCNLLPRFFDITDGKITIDGEDIRHYTLKSLRTNIGIVQQDVYLFSGTVMDNILYGRDGATREEAMEAARLADAEEFILGLKDGYDTYIGERGVKLSGGQKQRISIARVFLKNPPIMIFDEATSALDNESEYVVAASLAKLAKGRTTITIAHRLSTIKNADRILVLTDEGIAEEGNHEALMAKHGIYYDLYTRADRI